MPKQPITVELEAINREGELQTVQDSGVAVHGYSVYVRAVDFSGPALATWVFDSDIVEPAYELAERLSLALAIPLTVRVPTDLMPGRKQMIPTNTPSCITELT